MEEAVSSSPRAARTRAALLAAGLDLLVDRPVDGIPIDDLVAAAGVGKGSFFNHFADKQDFAEAISAEIRRLIESRVAVANQDVSDPVERLAGGMIVAAAFALSEPKRTAVLARAARRMTLAAHPLNRGVLEDLRASQVVANIRPEAARAGVPFWLGCCQALMGSIVEQQASLDEAADLLVDMLVLGLGGLGVAEAKVSALTTRRSVVAKLKKAMQA